MEEKVLGSLLVGGCWDRGRGNFSRMEVDIHVVRWRMRDAIAMDNSSSPFSMRKARVLGEEGGGDGTWHSCLPSAAYCELVEIKKVRRWIKYQANGLRRSALVLTCRIGTYGFHINAIAIMLS